MWFQNQYINFRGTDDDFNEFRLLVGALKEKVDKGREVRIICRDMMKQESVDVLVALGFPREVLRFQPACHNKTIIVDGKVVMFGSHNWSNEGVTTNRDASLIFDDEEIAAYLARSTIMTGLACDGTPHTKAASSSRCRRKDPTRHEARLVL